MSEEYTPPVVENFTRKPEALAVMVFDGTMDGAVALKNWAKSFPRDPDDPCSGYDSSNLHLSESMSQLYLAGGPFIEGEPVHRLEMRFDGGRDVCLYAGEYLTRNAEGVFDRMTKLRLTAYYDQVQLDASDQA